jgi:hypothetical protein
LSHLEGEVALAYVEEGRGVTTSFSAEYLSDKEGVIAGLVCRAALALEPAKCVLEEGSAGGTRAGRDSVPVREGRHPAREVLGEPFLVSREQAEGEAARASQQLVHGSLAADADADERRFERQ